MKFIKSFKEVLKELIKEEIKSTKSLDKYVVTGVNVTTGNVNIKRLNFNLQYDNVQCAGLGMGNLKGQIMLPKINDIVLVGFVDNTTPIVLGNLYDDFTSSPDNVLPIKQGEYIVSAKENGTYMHLKDDNSITFRCSDYRFINMDGSPSFSKTKLEQIEATLADHEARITINDSK